MALVRMNSRRRAKETSNGYPSISPAAHHSDVVSLELPREDCGVWHTEDFIIHHSSTPSIKRYQE